VRPLVCRYVCAYGHPRIAVRWCGATPWSRSVCRLNRDREVSQCCGQIRPGVRTLGPSLASARALGPVLPGSTRATGHRGEGRPRDPRGIVTRRRVSFGGPGRDCPKLGKRAVHVARAHHGGLRLGGWQWGAGVIGARIPREGSAVVPLQGLPAHSVLARTLVLSETVSTRSAADS